MKKPYIYPNPLSYKLIALVMRIQVMFYRTIQDVALLIPNPQIEMRIRV